MSTCQICKQPKTKFICKKHWEDETNPRSYILNLKSETIKDLQSSITARLSQAGTEFLQNLALKTKKQLEKSLHLEKIQKLQSKIKENSQNLEFLQIYQQNSEEKIQNVQQMLIDLRYLKGVRQTFYSNLHINFDNFQLIRNQIIDQLKSTYVQLSNVDKFQCINISNLEYEEIQQRSKDSNEIKDDQQNNFQISLTEFTLKQTLFENQQQPYIEALNLIMKSNFLFKLYDVSFPYAIEVVQRKKIALQINGCEISLSSPSIAHNIDPILLVFQVNYLILNNKLRFFDRNYLFQDNHLFHILDLNLEKSGSRDDTDEERENEQQLEGSELSENFIQNGNYSLSSPQQQQKQLKPRLQRKLSQQFIILGNQFASSSKGLYFPENAQSFYQNFTSIEEENFLCLDDLSFEQSPVQSKSVQPIPLSLDEWEIVD